MHEKSEIPKNLKETLNQDMRRSLLPGSESLNLIHVPWWFADGKTGLPVADKFSATLH